MRTAEKRPESPDAIREAVRHGYTKVAGRASSCCGSLPHVEAVSRANGYSEEQLRAVPVEANLGAGCGNPTAIDSLRPGEVVVDLGSGAGMDVFLAARQVGPAGRVIGVDMTDAMLAKARENARKGGYTNVEFRKGTIEDLPIDDQSVDVVLSNCVINLSPEKHKVFAEAYRVLKPGGRLMISDIVLDRELPPEVLDSVDAYLGCVGGASLRATYLQTIERAGFRDVTITGEKSAASAFSLEDPAIGEAMKRMEISADEALTYLASVTSVHVFARR